ncbi:sugar transferase [Geodermatophilus sp. SYSU D00815]
MQVSLAKDLLDRVVAAVLLLLVLPLLAGAALGLRLERPGPVLVRRPRVGEHGRPFDLLTFRTDEDDPRDTGLPRLLRRTGLDQLPQLVNVLRGEMSVVGPRPRRVEDLDPADDLPVRPGLTGLAPLADRAGSGEDAGSLVRYVENWSLRMDLAILWRSVRTAGRGGDAY